MDRTRRRSLGGVALAWAIGLGYLLSLGAPVAATAVAVVVQSVVTLLAGPDGLVERLQYGVVAGVVAVLGGVLVPELVRTWPGDWQQLAPGVRAVTSLVAAVVVLAVGLATVDRVLAMGEDASE